MHCRNLIHSIRRNGCRIPIRIIPYGGAPLRLNNHYDNVALVDVADFPAEGRTFVEELKKRLPQCSTGLLRRYLAWFGEFDEFLYSDNDVVAVMNWEELFGHLQQFELVHADCEYTTGGRFNFNQPEVFEQIMGANSLQQAVTAGHFLCRRDPRQCEFLLGAARWMVDHANIAKPHDQALLHIAVVLGNWKVLNLCKPPHKWASSWAGDYRDALDVIITIQARQQKISHIHFSGGVPSGAEAIQELLYAFDSPSERKRKLLMALLSDLSGLNKCKWYAKRARHKLRSLAR